MVQHVNAQLVLLGQGFGCFSQVIWSANIAGQVAKVFGQLHAIANRLANGGAFFNSLLGGFGAGQLEGGRGGCVFILFFAGREAVKTLGDGACAQSRNFLVAAFLGHFLVHGEKYLRRLQAFECFAGGTGGFSQGFGVQLVGFIQTHQHVHRRAGFRGVENHAATASISQVFIGFTGIGHQAFCVNIGPFRGGGQFALLVHRNHCHIASLGWHRPASSHFGNSARTRLEAEHGWRRGRCFFGNTWGAGFFGFGCGGCCCHGVPCCD